MQPNPTTYCRVVLNAFAQKPSETMKQWKLISADKFGRKASQTRYDEVFALESAVKHARGEEKYNLTIRLVEACEKTDLYEKARKACEKALPFVDSDAKKASLLVMGAGACEKMGDANGAILEYEKALEFIKSPAMRMAVNEKQAELHAGRKDYQMAAICYGLALGCASKDDKKVDLLIKQAEAFTNMGKPLDAIMAYSSANGLSSDPLERATLYLKICKVECDRNNIRGAIWARQQAAQEIGSMTLGLEPIEK